MDVPLNIINVILWIVGGLAIFLYGIELMGKALRRGVGKALRQGLNRFTKTPIHGLLTGTVLTGLIQSSSAATVMIVGFISAGLLTFSKSIGLILGANIGTTITPQITALKLDGYAVPIIAVGFLLNFISKKRVYRELGNAVMGVGFLLFGLLLMKFAVSGYSEIINHWLSYYTDAGARGWILAFAISIITTSII